MSFQLKFQVRCAAAKRTPHVRWGFKLKRTGVGDRHDVASAGCLLEMQLCSTIVDLPEHLRDAFVDLGMVRAVARDKLLNDCPQCLGRQLLMRNTYEGALVCERSRRSSRIRRSVAATFSITAGSQGASLPVPRFIKWLRHFDLFSFAACSFLTAVCFLLLSLSLSFLPPLSPIVITTWLEGIRAMSSEAIVADSRRRVQ